MNDPFTWLIVMVAAVAIILTLVSTISVMSDVWSSRGFGHEEAPPPKIYPLWLRIVIAAAMMSFLAIAFFGPWENLSSRTYFVFGIQLFGYLAYDAYLWLRRPIAETPRSNLS